MTNYKLNKYANKSIASPFAKMSPSKETVMNFPGEYKKRPIFLKCIGFYRHLGYLEKCLHHPKL